VRTSGLKWAKTTKIPIVTHEDFMREEDETFIRGLDTKRSSQIQSIYKNGKEGRATTNFSSACSKSEST